jgi:excisionase family DNA binding protein
LKIAYEKRSKRDTGAVVETYLNIEELAKYLGIAEKTIRKWVFNQDIPYRKIHKVIRFRLSEIERWIDGGGKLPLMNDEAGADGAALAGSGGEAGAACDLLPDDKNGSAVEASSVPAVADDEASAVGGKE